jgi:hypothetical protein
LCSEKCTAANSSGPRFDISHNFASSSPSDFGLKAVAFARSLRSLGGIHAFAKLKVYASLVAAFVFSLRDRDELFGYGEELRLSRNYLSDGPGRVERFELRRFCTVLLLFEPWPALDDELPNV